MAPRRPPLSGLRPVTGKAPARRTYRNAQWRARVRAPVTVVPVVSSWIRRYPADNRIVGALGHFVLQWHRDWSKP